MLTAGAAQTDASADEGVAAAADSGTDNDIITQDTAEETCETEISGQTVTPSTADTDTDTEESASSSGGLVLDKYLTDNGDGTVQVTLESYVTGETVTYARQTDIVIILDDSGSMTYTYYTADDGTLVTRREALVQAVKSFLSVIQEQNSLLETEDQIRVAVVKFSNPEEDVSELLLCDFTAVDETGTETIISSLDGLTGENKVNYTYPSYGLEEAADLLEGSGAERKAAVLFTDGQVAVSTSVDPDITAEEETQRSIEQAYGIKQEGTEIFGMSIYPGASVRATIPSADSTETVDIVDRFMYLISSCNPDADSYDYADGQVTGADGTQYYYTADSQTDFNDAFAAIAQTAGEADLELGTQTQLRDFLTGYFELVSDVTVYTEDYVPGSGSSENWINRTEVTDEVTVSVEEGCILVSGFDFAENYVSDTVHPDTDSFYGRRLLVVFSIGVKEGITFGGNQVYTNTDSSGIYADEEDLSALELFPLPRADISLNYALEAVDQTVYVPSTADLTGLVDWAEGFVPDGDLNEGVDIYYTVTDPDGTVIGTLSIPAGAAASECSWDWTVLETAQCGTYTITCVVTAVADGSYESVELEETAEVHVLYPELTLQDTTLAYGDEIDVTEGDQTVAAALGNHYISLTWICEDGTETGGEEGNAPSVGYRIAAVEGVATQDGSRIIQTQEDVPVTVEVFTVSDDMLDTDITEYTSFIHECGRDDCGYDEAVQGALGIRTLIHVGEESPADDAAETEETDETDDAGSPEEEQEDTQEGDEDTETEDTGDDASDDGQTDSTASSSGTGGSADGCGSAAEPETGEVTAEEDIPEEQEGAADGTETSSAGETGRDVPQTGDDSHWMLWMALAVLSAAGLAARRHLAA